MVYAVKIRSWGHGIFWSLGKAGDQQSQNCRELQEKDLEYCKSSKYTNIYNELKTNFGIEGYLNMKMPITKTRIINQALV